MTRLTDATTRAFHRHLADAQRDARLPSLSAAVWQRGEEVAVHRAGDPEPGPATQYRIGSITKPFNAILVLQLRDEGRLCLDDPLDDHLPGTPVGDVTIGDLLTHRSGLRREPPGEFWEATPGSSGGALVAGLGKEDVSPRARGVGHYSNLGFALLGLVVARLRDLPWAEALDRHVLRPLELRDTTYLPREPHARGLRVDPLTQAAIPEPAPDTGAMAPAGQLWSTPGDLGRFGSFLADPVAEVLAPATVEEMCRPHVVLDPDGWTAAHGLGLQLFRRGELVTVGHGGSMPGFLAGLAVHRASGVVGSFCTNAWQPGLRAPLSLDLVDLVVDDLARDAAPWAAQPAPAELRELLGVWWWRGIQHLLHVRHGALHLRRAADTRGAGATRWEPEGPDRYVGVSGPDLGERLEVVRTPAGEVAHLVAGGWRYTRDPDDPATV